MFFRNTPKSPHGIAPDTVMDAFAQEQLSSLWRYVGVDGVISIVRQRPMGKLMGNGVIKAVVQICFAMHYIYANGIRGIRFITVSLPKVRKLNRRDWHIRITKFVKRFDMHNFCLPHFRIQFRLLRKLGAAAKKYTSDYPFHALLPNVSGWMPSPSGRCVKGYDTNRHGIRGCTYREISRLQPLPLAFKYSGIGLNFNMCLYTGA